MTKALLKYNYPQIVFSGEIASYLRKTGKPFVKIIDCPCGNGETAYQIAKLTHAKVIAADISPESIQKAQNFFSDTSIKFEVNSIESVLKTEKTFDAFCLINSLFLLEDYDSILKALKQSVTENKAQLLIIIPNTEGKNFKWFQSLGNNENKLIIKEDEIKQFFTGYGFKTDYIKPICYTHHYNRIDVKLFSIFWSVYLNFLNRIQTFFKIGKANYFLIALTAQ